MDDKIKNIEELKVKALKLRKSTFLAFAKHGEAHLGGSFSIIEILIILYNNILNNKDKFILSKAHASFPLCLLLRDQGLKPSLTTHLELDPDNGIFCTTGSLGHGFPIAAGMALARKKMNLPGSIYVMISDGECQEGTTWETLLIGAKHKLDNLVLIIDYNKIQALMRIEEVLPLNDLSKKIKAFNWECLEVSNGHSFNQLDKAFNNKKMIKKPTAVIINTIKGKGIKPFENDPVWHAKKIKDLELKIGKKELGIS